MTFAIIFLSKGEVRRGFDNTPVHFFFFISMKKEKVEPKKKNTNDKMVRVIRGYAPEPLMSSSWAKYLSHRDKEEGNKG